MNLKDDEQQNIQMQLDFSSALTGEAREAGREETESSGAMNGTESPASTNRLMEEVCERENLKAALQRVKANLWNRKPFTGHDATSLASLFRIHRSSLLMGTNRRGAAVRDPTFGSIMRPTLDLLPLRSGQKTLLLQDGLRQGYASKRQSYEFCRNIRRDLDESEMIVFPGGFQGGRKSYYQTDEFKGRWDPDPYHIG